MASVLVSSVIDEFQLAFTDCSDANALTLFNKVHNDLLEMRPFKVTQEDISLTAADYEYSLNELTSRVWSADYLTSSTESKRLIEYDYEWYNREHPNWRIRPTGPPSGYMIWRSGTSIGVYLTPIPQTATDGGSGYPIVRLDVSRQEDLAASGMTPAGLGSTDVYIAGMAKRWASYRKRDQQAFWSKRYEEELARELHTWDARSAQTNPMLMPDWIPVVAVV